VDRKRIDISVMEDFTVRSTNETRVVVHLINHPSLKEAAVRESFAGDLRLLAEEYSFTEFQKAHVIAPKDGILVYVGSVLLMVLEVRNLEDPFATDSLRWTIRGLRKEEENFLIAIATRIAPKTRDA
jgi:hypothetical protein